MLISRDQRFLKVVSLTAVKQMHYYRHHVKFRHIVKLALKSALTVSEVGYMLSLAQNANMEEFDIVEESAQRILTQPSANS